MQKKGWIALDIDGTITADKTSVPIAVSSYLKSLFEEGWQVALATGRSLAYAEKALRGFGFPYYLIAQNGTLALQMPESRFLFKHYLDPIHLPLIEKAHKGIPGDFLVYAGFERGDVCFYRKERFSALEENYLKDLQARQVEKWIEVQSFDSKEIGFFPLAKCFGKKSDMQKIKNFLEKSGKFEVAHIKDPQYEGIYILLITQNGVNKGFALRQLMEQEGRGAVVIAAGDDANDKSLLLVADRKICMPHAPQELLKLADTIARPVEEMGIILALQQEIEYVSRSGT